MGKNAAIEYANDLFLADQADLIWLKRAEGDSPAVFGALSSSHIVHAYADIHDVIWHVNTRLPVDLIVIDVAVPASEDLELCRTLRQIPALRDIPIVFLTEPGSLHNVEFGASADMLDMIEKSLSPALLLARVANHVSHGRVLRMLVSQNDALDHRVSERTTQLAQRNLELQNTLRQLAKTQDATIIAFLSLAETRDNETGRHLRRTQNYVRELALKLRDNSAYSAQLDDEAIDLIYKSAPLHDIGKVAIPDHILLKKGSLNEAEFEIMKTHAEHGFRVISLAESGLGEYNSFLHVAREIAYGHHEKWDGSGYPNGHAGIEIPLSARLMALADVYDALISRRVYKPSMSHSLAVNIIARARASHFDPAIVDAFMKIHPSFAKIAGDLVDSPAE
mgnify:CR=1 FL=1